MDLDAGAVADIERMLRPAGVAPADVDALLWAAAVGVAHELWRDSPLEDWHAGPDSVISDGQMMRANAATVRLIRHHLALAGTDWSGLAQAVTDAGRVLPDGRSVRQLAGRWLAALRRHAAGQAEVYARIQDAAGPRAALLLAAAQGVLHGSRWHGMPRWPQVVQAFCRAVDDPADPHWRVRPLTQRRPRPASIADTAVLRRLLLEGPDPVGRRRGGLVRARRHRLRPRRDHDPLTGARAGGRVHGSTTVSTAGGRLYMMSAPGL